MTSVDAPRVWLNPAALRTIRRCRGLTTSELGAKVGVHAAHIRHLELGSRGTGIEMVSKLAAALAVRWDALAVNLDELDRLRGMPDDDAG